MPKINKSEESKMLHYKEKPLVRKGNEIYYGDMSDKYVVMLNVKNTKNSEGVELSEDISIQLMLTDPEIKLQDRIRKSADRKGLYPALDLAQVWLERALKE